MTLCQPDFQYFNISYSIWTQWQFPVIILNVGSIPFKCPLDKPNTFLLFIVHLSWKDPTVCSELKFHFQLIINFRHVEMIIFAIKHRIFQLLSQAWSPSQINCLRLNVQLNKKLKIKPIFFMIDSFAKCNMIFKFIWSEC